MKIIQLQQDAAEKIKVSAKEETIVYHLKKYFKWRKDITMQRFSKLGTMQHDLFIKYLSTHLN